MNDNVQISFGADIGNVTQNLGVMHNDFKEFFNEMQADVKRMASSVDSSMKDMTNSIKQANTGFAGMGDVVGRVKTSLIGFAAGFAIGEMIKNVVSTTTEFERLRSVLLTLEGSQEAANARFKELSDFAKKTPYDLEQVVTAFTKLKGRGLDPSQKAMTAYGNIASGMGKSLDQMVEAVGDAAAGQMERLRDFNIIANQQGDKVTFTFNNVKTTVGRNSKEIQEYLQSIGNTKFGDSMNNQMTTLGGAFSNVGDAVHTFMDQIGQSGLSGAIKTVIGDMMGATGSSEELAGIIGGTLNTIIIECWDIIKTLGSVVSDIFSTIGEIIRDVVGKNVSNLSIWQGALATVRTAVIAVGFVFQEMAVIVGGAIRSAIVWINAFLKAANSLRNFDMSGAVDAVTEAVDKQVTIVKEGIKQAADIQQKEAANVKSAWEGVGKVKEKVSKAGLDNSYKASTDSIGGTGGGKKGKSASTKDNEFIKGLEKNLEEQKIVLEKQNDANNTFYSFSKQKEAEYWKSILDKQNMSADQRLLVEKKYYAANIAARREGFDNHISNLKNELDSYRNNMDERLRIATQISAEMKAKFGAESREARQAALDVVAIEKSKADQLKSINAEIADAQLQSAMDGVESRQAAADFELQMGIINQQQMIQMQEAFEEERYNIQKQALENRKQLMLSDPDKNPVEYQQVLTKIEELERRHAQKMKELQQNSTLQTTQRIREGIQNLSKSWANTLGQMMTGQMSFAQGVKSLWQGLVGAIVQAFTSMIAEWIAQQLIALVFGKGTKAADASGKIMANAGVAASGAYAATAAIPVVGPALAPAAAATAMAGAMSFMPLAFAAKGYDIPRGVNPLVQAHQEEMILPAVYANPLRNFLRNAGPMMSDMSEMATQKFSQSGQSVTNVEGGREGDVNISMSSMDSKSGLKFFFKNKRGLAKAIKRAYREGVRI